MYEYAAIAMEPNNSGANFKVVKIDVGPSAPPMIANDAACFMVNIPDAAAISRTAKFRTEQQHQNGKTKISQHWTEICQCTHAHEDDRRNEPGFNNGIVDEVH